MIVWNVIHRCSASPSESGRRDRWNGRYGRLDPRMYRYGVLREGTERLLYRSFKTRIRSGDSPLISERGTDVAIQHGGALGNVAKAVRRAGLSWL